MMRLITAGFALVLSVVPLAAAPLAPVALVGGVALLLALVGIATRWRPPVVAAACVFLLDYAGALWLADAPTNIVVASAFGLLLVLLLQSMELARVVRGSALVGRVVPAQIVRWAAFAAATLATTMLAMVLAGGLVSSIPFVAAPFLAAAGALGVVLALGSTLKRMASRRSHEAQ